MMQANRRRFWRYQVDAGWAWVVCFTSFFVHCVTFGTIQSFGTLFISLQNDFNSGESATAWVGSLGYGFLFVIGPLTAALCEHFGCRVMACTGSVLTTTALLATSFASNISTMYFTFGILWGTGGSFLYFSGLLILRFYFNTHLSFANGITMTGAGFGTLIFNVLLQELDAKYGWRGGMRVLSVFSALTFLCGCTYIPPPIDYLAFERPSLLFRLKRLIDPRPWREPAFPVWVLSLSFILFAYFFPYTYLVKMALTLGIPVSQGALLLGYLSISAIFGKLLCGKLADLPRVRRLYIFVTSATILSVSFMCVTAAKTYHGLLAYAIVAGFFDGCFVLTVPLITQDIVGKDLMAKAIGSMYGVVAFPLTLGPPVLGELYKSTGSFTTAFFVSACFILVGVSLTYIVQRIRPDLVRKQEPTREEVIPSPSIHSASVVDTLSGLCVTPEPHLSVSHLDPIEIGSYQRFDSFRPENPRATIADPVQGRLANKTEIEAVYKQAVDNLSTTGVSGHNRTGSDANSITKSNVSARSHSGSVFSGSLLSSTEMTGNSDSPSGLQITLGETKELPKSADSCATLVNTNNVQLSDEEEVKIPDTDGTMVQEGDQGMHQTDVPKDELSLTSENAATPLIDTQTSLEANCAEEDEKVSVAQLDSDFPVQFTKDQPLQRKPLDNKETDLSDPVMADNIRDTEPEVEMVKLPPPPESNRKRRAGPNAQDEEDNTGEDDENAFKPTSDRVSEGFLDTQKVLSDGLTFQDSTIPLLGESCSSDRVDAVQEETLDVNEVLELLRLPPPPAIPRTGQLVALENEATDDLRDSNFTEREGTSVGHASLSEVQLDACKNDVFDREGVKDCYSAKEVSTAQRKEGLHLAIIDQLNLLSERLEVVAARQIQEEEQINDNEDTQDQRPVFSPALQSLPLTPLYSANHSVPLTPVRAWSGSVTTPAPTPLQTPPSAFHTTAPTPISTPRLASQSVSGVFNVSSEIQTPSPIHTQDSNDVIDVCSPSSSQGAMSRHRSRCSSFSEVGQEYMLNEWSYLDQRDPQGSIEVFPSKPSSGTNSSISNSARSLGDLNSVSDPIDVVDNTASHGGHFNSPENIIDDQELELELELPMCRPQQPENPFQQTYLNTNQTERQPGQMYDYTYNVEEGTLSMEMTSDKEQFCNEGQDYMPQQTTQQQFNNTDNAEESIHQPSPIKLTTDQAFTGYEPESENIPQPSSQDDFSHKGIFNSTASNPQACLPDELTSDFIADPIQQSRMDPSPLESKINPFSDSDRVESIEVSQQNPFQQNEVCSSAGVPDEPQSFITSNVVAVPIQQTCFDSNPLESQSKSYLEKDPGESADDSQEISHQSSFQQHDICSLDGSPDELQNTCEIPKGLVPQAEQLLPIYKPTSETTEQYHFKAKEMDIDATPSDSYGSTKLDVSPRTSEFSYQHDHTENLGDQQIMAEQTPLMTTELGTRLSPEESKDDHAEPVFITLDSTKEENDRTLENQSSWTTFTGSEEALIFEMDTESESSPESSAKVESASAIASRETKYENQDPHAVTSDQNILFPPLQIFSDMVDSTVEASRPGVYKKLPPPPRQNQRKRTDIPVCVNSHKVVGSHSQLEQEISAEPEGRRLEERQVHSIQKGPVMHESGVVESHPVSSDGDLSATLNSVSEIESDASSASKLAEPTHDQCSSKLSDNSITDIICQEFEFIEGNDVLTMNEELDDANLDGDLAKTSIHDDIAPLLMQSEEPIQYLNLRDLPEDFSHVLQKRPSTTSSTDDSSTSSTSTDSSLSETEMPQYTKLHEDFDTSEHG